MKDPNDIALDNYLREIDDADSWTALQVEVDDAILECEGKEPTKDLISWVCDEEEWAEVLAKVKAHRAADGRGASEDWQQDSAFYEHVHGVFDDRTSEDD